MLIQAILLLPAVVSLIWAFLFCSRKGANRQLKSLAVLAALASVSFYAESVMTFRFSTNNAVFYADILYHIAALAVLPCCYIYIRHVDGASTGKWTMAVLFAPAAFFAGACIATYAIISKGEALSFLEAAEEYRAFPVPGYEGKLFRLYDIINIRVFSWMLSAEILLLAGYLLRVLHKSQFTMGNLVGDRMSHDSQVSSISASLIFLVALTAARIVLGRYYLMDHPSVNIVLAVVVSFEIFRAGYAAMRLLGFERAEIEAAKAIRKESEPIARAQEPVKSSGFVPDDRSTMERLRDNMERYMAGSPAPYLNPNLTIADVASALGTNRTYISVLLNQYYKQTFRDFIASARISAAKLILMEHPEMPLDAVADASGYLSSSQLIKKFKEIEGVPPRAWMQQQRLI